MSTNEVSFLNSRFREERIRVGLSHSETADACGYSRGSVIAWEKETALPAQALERLVSHGFDAQYIVSGVRSENVQQAASSSSDASLSADEWKLIKLFRSLAERERPTALRLVGVLAAGGAVEGSGNVTTKGSGTHVVATSGGRASAGDYYENSSPPPKRKR